MALYLVQHGISNPKEIDPERGLSDKGREKAELISGVAKGYKVKVGTICHSGKKRAIETAEIYAKALEPSGGITRIEGINPLDDVKSFSSILDSSANNMYIGHLPFLGKLVSLLTTGNDELNVFRLQNAGVICLDKEEGSELWYIKWAIMPEIG